MNLNIIEFLVHSELLFMDLKIDTLQLALNLALDFFLNLTLAPRPWRY